jgi:hypothetical protein
MSIYYKLIGYKRSGGSIAWRILHHLSKGRLKRQLLHTRKSNITHSARRINRLLTKSPSNYLEIGVAYGLTLEGVTASYKYAVDPNPMYSQSKTSVNTKTFRMTSNEFFETLPSHKVFDVIFLDGLHTKEQLLTDLVNSFKHINAESWILIDDILPSDSISAIPNLETSHNLRASLGDKRKIWHGDCFKLLPILNKYFPQFHQFLIIYPDNPQLLLRLRQGLQVPDFAEMDSYTYYDSLAPEILSKYEICIEEPFFAKLEDLIK